MLAKLSATMVRTTLEIRQARVVDITIKQKRTTRGRRNQVVVDSPEISRTPEAPRTGSTPSGGRRSRTVEAFQPSEAPIIELAETALRAPPQVFNVVSSLRNITLNK